MKAQPRVNKCASMAAQSVDFFRAEVMERVCEHVGGSTVPGALFQIKADNGFDLSPNACGDPDKAISGICGHIVKHAPFPVAVYRHAIDQFYLYARPQSVGAQGLRDAADVLRGIAVSYGMQGVKPMGGSVALVIGATALMPGGNVPEAFYRAHLAFCRAREKSLLFASVCEDTLNRDEIIRGQVSAGYIHKALEEKRLRFAYQPVVDCKNNSVAYYECLLRLVEKDFTIVPAGAFIPLAERMGFIDTIDRYVFDLALEELKNYPDISFSVNVSTTTIQRDGYHDFLDALKADPAMAERLMVEVTESGMREDMDKIRKFMHEFRDAGCQVALDDFGVGHTSFAQLVTLPMDVVKVDGKFIRGLKTAPENWLLVDTVIKYGKQSNKKTVAEFVENEELATELINMDIDYLQGNYFSPAANTRLWLEDV